jgi:hypothetical protein
LEGTDRATRNASSVDDGRITKWKRWCDNTIKNDVITLYLHRDAWQEVSKIIDGNRELPDSYWWQFMFDTYAVTQAVAVRRQADLHKDVASLGKLIQEIRDDASRITRDSWIALWATNDPSMRTRAERGWACNTPVAQKLTWTLRFRRPTLML